MKFLNDQTSPNIDTGIGTIPDPVKGIAKVHMAKFVLVPDEDEDEDVPTLPKGSQDGNLG